MNCRSCGSENAAAAAFCKDCRRAMPESPPRGARSDAADTGDTAGAVQGTSNSRTWMWVAIGFGLAVALFLVGFMAFLFTDSFGLAGSSPASTPAPVVMSANLLTPTAAVESPGAGGGKPMLYYAMREDNAVELVRLLVEAGADVDAKDGGSLEPMLYHAIYNEDNAVELVRLLVEAGADVDAKSGGSLRPMLYHAIYNEDNAVELVRLLVEAGVDVNATDAGGRRMLYHAIREGNAEVIQILVDADPKAIAEPTATPSPEQSEPPTESDVLRTSFESSTPAGYARVTLTDGGTVWGVPERFTSDSSEGVVVYMLLGRLKGCDFANQELDRSSIVYVRWERLGRLSKYESQEVCREASKIWNTSWEGWRITHLLIFDDNSPTNVREYVYDSDSGQHVESSAASGGAN